LGVFEASHSTENDEGGTMNQLVVWIILIGVISALEIAFGIDDTGFRVAMAASGLCVSSLILTLYFSKVESIIDLDYEHY
jgi:hypothetical protein